MHQNVALIVRIMPTFREAGAAHDVTDHLQELVSVHIVDPVVPGPHERRPECGGCGQVGVAEDRGRGHHPAPAGGGHQATDTHVVQKKSTLV